MTDMPRDAAEAKPVVSTGAAGEIGMFDAAVRQAVVDGERSKGTVGKLLHELGARRTLFPALITAYAAGHISGRPRLTAFSRQSLAALLVGGIVSEASKRILGRTRPQDGADPDRWGATHDKSAAFPSGHATNVLAVLTVAADHRGVSPVTAAGAVAGVAILWSRMTSDRHWATDILAGMAIGFLAAKTIRYYDPGTAHRRSKSDHLLETESGDHAGHRL